MEKKTAKREQINGNCEVTIATYSEKAFVVYGDTKPLKAMLKELKLRYNPALKCGAGWIGSMRRVDEACELLNLELVKMSDGELCEVGARRAAEKEAAKAVKSRAKE